MNLFSEFLQAIGDAVGGRVARTTFSAPMIKATSFARGTSRTIARLRGGSRRTSIGPVDVRAIESAALHDARPPASSTRWRRRA
jgi:hypothetical protein